MIIVKDLEWDIHVFQTILQIFIDILNVEC